MNVNACQIAVAVIIYRRPELTRRVLSAVYKANPRKLYVIADGPKPDARDSELVHQARSVVEEFSWKCEIERLYAQSNLGLRQRVLSGLDEIFQREDQLIVLEDDCVPSGSFFQFAEAGLLAFAETKNVSLISGSNPSRLFREQGYFFTMDSPIWGWATWRDRWQDFRDNSIGNAPSRVQIEQVSRSSKGFWARRKLRKFLATSSQLDSWAIEFAGFNRWKNKLSVVSGENLVSNIGFGKDSTHTKFESFADQAPALDVSNVSDFFNSKVEMVNSEGAIHRWRTLQWVTYPLVHPISFTRRALRFLFK